MSCNAHLCQCCMMAMQVFDLFFTHCQSSFLSTTPFPLNPIQTQAHTILPISKSTSDCAILPSTVAVDENVTPVTPPAVKLSPTHATTYYYYPKRLIASDPLSPAFEYVTVTRARHHHSTPSTPALSTATTAYTPSPPPTPTITMARGAPRVDFAKEVKSRRPPREDEVSVMRHFSGHVSRCSRCDDPYQAWKHGDTLCNRGQELARDVLTYIYSKDGKPFSVIDRDYNDERTEIEVPADCEVVKRLVKALDQGFSVRKRQKPVVTHEKVDRQPSSPYREHRESPPKVQRPREERREERRQERREERPREGRYREGDHDVIIIAPSSSRNERKDRPASYRDDHDRSERRRTVYEEKKGSYYVKDEEEKKQRQRYEMEPIIIVAQPRRVRR